MSKINRVTAIAAGLTILIALTSGGYILGFGLGVQSGDKQAKTDTYARHAQDEISSTCAGLDGSSQTECIVRVVEATNEHKRSQSDLNAQRNMAKWALWMLIFTFVMAVVTALGVYYVWRTLAVSREIGQKQTKAYITGIHVKVDKSHDPIRLEIRLKNTGNSPTKGVLTVSRMCYLGTFLALHDMPETNPVSLKSSDIPAQSEQTVVSYIELAGNERFFADFATNYEAGHCAPRIVVAISWKDVFGNQDQCTMVFDTPINRGEFKETSELIEYYGLSRTNY